MFRRKILHTTTDCILTGRAKYLVLVRTATSITQFDILECIPSRLQIIQYHDRLTEGCETVTFAVTSAQGNQMFVDVFPSVNGVEKVWGITKERDDTPWSRRQILYTTRPPICYCQDEDDDDEKQLRATPR